MTTHANIPVEAVLAEMELTLKPEFHDKVARELQERLTYDPADHRFYLTDLNGYRATTLDDAGNVSDQTLRDYFGDLRKSSPLMFEEREASGKAPAAKPMTVTARMVALKAAQKDDRRERAAEVAKAGNPWAMATRNLTRQGLIQNLDPQLAARLRAEAGDA